MAALDLIKKAVGLKKTDLLDDLLIRQNWNIKYGPFFHRRKYGTKDIIDVLKGFGIGRGSNLFIHSSWDAFYNYLGNEQELIDAVLDLIGPEGTLAMPAIPLIRKGKLFNVKRSVTSAGLMPETFRHYPGVKRSANVRHSVCALGPLAEELTGTHHQSLIRFDENSPFYKMCKTGDFKVVSIGLPAYFIGTIIHCTEATMWREIPYFRSFYDFEHKVEHRYIDEEGMERSYWEAGDRCGARSLFSRNQRILRRWFDPTKRGKKRISNLWVSYVDADYTYQRLCELARQGVVLYIRPKFFR